LLSKNQGVFNCSHPPTAWHAPSCLTGFDRSKRCLPGEEFDPRRESCQATGVEPQREPWSGRGSTHDVAFARHQGSTHDRGRGQRRARPAPTPGGENRRAPQRPLCLGKRFDARPGHWRRQGSNQRSGVSKNGSDPPSLCLAAVTHWGNRTPASPGRRHGSGCIKSACCAGSEETPTSGQAEVSAHVSIPEHPEHSRPHFIPLARPYAARSIRS
jgi:hypothetical protein